MSYDILSNEDDDDSRTVDKATSISEYGDKLSAFGIKGIEMKIRQFKVECGGKGGAAIGAKALLEIINHKKRARLQW